MYLCETENKNLVTGRIYFSSIFGGMEVGNCVCVCVFKDQVEMLPPLQFSLSLSL